MSIVRRVVQRFGRRISFRQNPYLVARSPSYNADGFATVHAASFLGEARFQHSYRMGLSGIPDQIARRSDIRWRAHLACWAAQQALALPLGDFVECGVWYGILSRTIAEYTDFGSTDRHFYLVDPFGNPLPNMTHYENDIFSDVKERFSSFPNIHLVRGLVPDSLSEVPSDAVAYLSIDMNSVEPERAALEHFYPRLVPGAVIYFDDYGWAEFSELRNMVDEFFSEKPETVLSLPTGQALVVKAG